MGWIYLIHCLLTNKQYIGQTRKSLEERWNRHRFRRYDTHISRAIHKYGENQFMFIPIEHCHIQDLNEREVFWIKSFGTLSPKGYNLRGGGGVYLILSQEVRDKLHHSDEVKKRISESKKNPSDLTRKRIGDARRGRHHSMETKVKMRQSHLGKKLSEAAKEKLRQKAVKRYGHSE